MLFIHSALMLKAHPFQLSKSRPMGVSQRPWEDMISLAHKVKLIRLGQQNIHADTWAVSMG